MLSQYTIDQTRKCENLIGILDDENHNSECKKSIESEASLNSEFPHRPGILIQISSKLGDLHADFACSEILMAILPNDMGIHAESMEFPISIT